jgi:hypothetical protein
MILNLFIKQVVSKKWKIHLILSIKSIFNNKSIIIFSIKYMYTIVNRKSLSTTKFHEYESNLQIQKFEKLK